MSKHVYNADQVLRRLIHNHISPYRWRILAAVIFMIITASCSAYAINLVKPTIDQIFITRDRNMLVIYPLMIVAVYSAKGVAEYCQNYLIKYTGQQILTDLQMLMYEHLLKSDLSYIYSQSSGRLISRLTNDIAMMRGSISNILVGCAKYFLTVVFLIIVMFKLEPSMSAAVFGAFPLAIYPVQKLGRRMRKVSTQAQEELGNYTSTLDEAFHSIKVIKSFSGEIRETRRARLIVDNLLKFYKRSARLDALTSPIMEILSGISIGGILWYGGMLVIDGKTTPGTLMAFITAFAAAYRPFKSLLSLNVNLQEGMAAARRIFTVLDLKQTISDKEDAKEISLNKPRINFNSVSLHFGKKVALNGINFSLKYGNTIAFVGRSGSGKTSISNLLVRFFDYDSGQILINDTDIKDIKISSLRHQTALVTQDTILFNTTIAENIAYAVPNATKEEIINAAKSADAHEFIQKLPEGYDTIIGTQGSTLSGGQRQRIAIARALLKNAPILIFDEATSALDSNSERYILNSLLKIRGKDQLTIIITHRLSSITDIDEIIVMNSGQIVEQGTHKELLDKGAEYCTLYNKEMSELSKES